MIFSSLAVKVGAVLPLAQSGLGPEFFHNRSNPNCVQRNGAFCFSWAVDNFDRYVGPALKQAMLVSISVAIGFIVAMAMALLSHRYRTLVPPLTGFTGILYTVPSLAFFALLIPITSHAGPLRILLPEDPDQTGLRVVSYLKCESIGPIHKSRLKKRIGRIPAHAWPALEAGLTRVLGLN